MPFTHIIKLATNRSSFRLLVLIFLFSLISCDGGKNNEEELLTGKFLDSSVQGLQFRTSKVQGITNELGEFSYYQDENITFSIGDIILGTAQTSLVMTPLSLLSQKDQYALPNILRFLQTLDEDNNTENGITISENSRQKAVGLTLDFTQPVLDFEQDFVLTEFLKGIDKSIEDVSSGEALLHFQKTLADNNLLKNDQVSTVKLNGTVIGLNGTLTLSNYGIDTIQVFNKDYFEFGLPMLVGNRYFIKIVKQPLNQECRVINPNGSILDDRQSSAIILCKNTLENISKNIAGIITGLRGTLVLSINDTNFLISKNGAFSIPGVQDFGNIFIDRQPDNQNCKINRTGGIIGIDCNTPLFNLGGNISGLKGELTLINQGESITVSNQAFQFENAYPSNVSYNVIILSEPVGQNCQVINAQGYFSNRNINNLQVTCVDDIHAVTVHIAGIAKNISVTLNDIAMQKIGKFTYQTFLPFGAAYVVAVTSKTETKVCTVDENVGQAPVLSNAIQNNIDLYFNCVNGEHYIYFNARNLLSAINITLQDSLRNNRIESISGSTKISQVSPGESYQLSITNDVIGQTCNIDNTSIIIDKLITNVTIDCSTLSFENQLQVNGLFGDIILFDLSENPPASYLINSNNRSIIFKFGHQYKMSIDQTSLTGQDCQLSNAAGKMPANNVSSVILDCSPQDAELEIQISGALDSVNLNIAISRDNIPSIFPITYNQTGSYNYRLPYYSDYSLSFDSTIINDQYSCSFTNSNQGYVDQAKNGPVIIVCQQQLFNADIATNNLQGNVTLVVIDEQSQTSEYIIDKMLGYSVTLNRSSNYTFSIKNWPVNQSCILTGSVNVNNVVNDINDLTIECIDLFTVSLDVSGLNPVIDMVNTLGEKPSMLIAHSIEGNVLQSIFSENGVFQLDSGIYRGDIVSLSIVNRPYAQDCDFVLSDQSRVKNIIIDSIQLNQKIMLNCHLLKYDLIGNITHANLLANEVVALQGSDNETQTFDVLQSQYSFAGKLAYGDNYEIVFSSIPANIMCEFIDNSGDVTDYTNTNSQVFFKGEANIVQDIACYNLFDITIKIMGSLPDGITVNNQYIDHNGFSQIDSFDFQLGRFNQQISAGSSIKITTNSRCTIENGVSDNINSDIDVLLDCRNDLINNLDNSIPDPVFLSCIKNYSINNSWVYISEISELICDGPQNVTDLYGVTAAEDITDITGINILSNLTNIVFANTAIKNFQPLRNMDSLKATESQISITNNTYPMLKDIVLDNNFRQCLYKLYTDTTRLDEVLIVECDDTGVNRIQNIDGIENLFNLRALYLNNQSVIDIYPLTKLQIVPILMESPLVELVINKNQTDAGIRLTEIAGIDNNSKGYGLYQLRSLKILDLRDNNIQNFDSLLNTVENVLSLNRLNYLNLDNNAVTPDTNLVNYFTTNIAYYTDSGNVSSLENDLISNTNKIDIRSTDPSKLYYSAFGLSQKSYSFPLENISNQLFFHNFTTEVRLSPNNNRYSFVLQKLKNGLIVQEVHLLNDYIYPDNQLTKLLLDSESEFLQREKARIIGDNLEDFQYQFMITVASMNGIDDFNDWYFGRIKVSIGVQ